MTEIAYRVEKPGMPKPSASWVDWLKSPRLAPGISVLLFLVGWQLIVPLLPTEQLPMPRAVGEFLINELRSETISPYTVYDAFGLSLARLGIGLAISGVIGIAIGIWMGVSWRVEAFFHDLVMGAMAMPHLVFALLFAMWLGFGFWTPVVTVILSAVPFVIINVAEGVRDIPKDLLDMGRAYNVGRFKVLRHIVAPSLVPYLFAAARYSVSLGWKALVIAELFGASDGAGWVLRYFYDAHRITGLIGYAFFFVFLSMILDLVLFKWLKGRVLRWQPSVIVR
jgi:ABC-type nitrate/sulfonate/bicarbonate transport system permease component